MTNKTKQAHTPGPWKADHSGYGDATVICDQYRMHIVNRCSWSDARLIAAAPDLLAALKTAEHTNAVFCSQHSKQAHGACCESLEQVRAAIAKAEGR